MPSLQEKPVNYSRQYFFSVCFTAEHSLYGKNKNSVMSNTATLFCCVHTCKDTPESTMSTLPKAEIVCRPSDR